MYLFRYNRASIERCLAQTHSTLPLTDDMINSGQIAMHMLGIVLNGYNMYQACKDMLNHARIQYGVSLMIDYARIQYALWYTILGYNVTLVTCKVSLSALSSTVQTYNMVSALWFKMQGCNMVSLEKLRTLSRVPFVSIISVSSVNKEQ